MADRNALMQEKQDDIEKFNEERVADLKQKEDDLVQAFLNPEVEEDPSKEPEAAAATSPTKVEKKAPVAAGKAAPQINKNQSQKSMGIEDQDQIKEWGEKEMEVCKIRLNFMTDLLVSDETYKARFNAMPLKKVVKFHDFMRAVFYFLETNKELVCEDGT